METIKITDIDKFEVSSKQSEKSTIQVNNSRLLEKNFEKLYDMINYFKTKILKEFELTTTKKEDYEILFKLCEEDEFPYILTSCINQLIKNRMQLMINLERVDEMIINNDQTLNSELIFNTFVTLAENIIILLKENLSNVSVQQEVWEYIFIESMMTVHVKLFELWQKDIFRPPKDFIISSEKYLQAIGNFCQILKIFQNNFSSTIDTPSFIFNISHKFEKFFIKLFGVFTKVMDREFQLIKNAFLIRKQYDTNGTIIPVDIEFSNYYSKILQKKRIFQTVFNFLNSSRFEINTENLINKVLVYEAIKKKKREMFLYKRVSHLLNYIQSIFDKLFVLPFYSETLTITFVNKLSDFFLFISSDMTKFFNTDEKLENLLIYFSSVKYLQHKVVKFVNRLQNSMKVDMPPFLNLLRNNRISCFEDFFTDVNSSLKLFQNKYSNFFLINLDEFLWTHVIKSLTNTDWRYPKNEPTSLQQLSKDSKNKAEIQKTYPIKFSPSYGLITLFLHLNRMFFEIRPMLFECNEIFQTLISLINKSTLTVLSFYKDLCPVKEKFRYFISDLFFVLDNYLEIYSCLSYRYLSFIYINKMFSYLTHKQELFIFLLKAQIIIGIIEETLFTIINNEAIPNFAETSANCNSMLNLLKSVLEVGIDDDMKRFDEIKASFKTLYHNFLVVMNKFVSTKEAFEYFQENNSVVFLLIDEMFSPEEIQEDRYNLIIKIQHFLVPDTAGEDRKFYPNYLRKIRRNSQEKKNISSLFTCNIEKQDFVSTEFESYLFSRRLRICIDKDK